jgi:hypothetical protein
VIPRLLHRKFVHRSSRVAAVALLGLLLLGLQLETQRHAYAHLGAALHRVPDTGLTVPVAQDACTICELLAGSANATPATAVSHNGISADFVAPLPIVATAAAPAPLLPYRSRAPPSLL